MIDSNDNSTNVFFFSFLENENVHDVEPDEVRIDIASSGETEGSINPPPYSSSSTPTIRRIRSVQVQLSKCLMSIFSFPLVSSTIITNAT